MSGGTFSGVKWDGETDLLVLGSGAGGMSAAIFGRKLGMRVLLCEKASVLGGTTATSGGVAWIPGNAHARAAGVVDSPELVRTYLQAELGNHFRPELVHAFIAAAPLALAELENGTDVAFGHTEIPDYHSSQVGALSAGRSVETKRFDGRLLGRDFALLRPPIRRLLLLGGIFLDRRQLNDFLDPFASAATTWRITKVLARYATDRLRFSRGTDIGAGNALIGRMLLTLRRQKADIWTDAALAELVREGDRVSGAVVVRGGKTLRIRATKGVVLATGGFPHNARMRAELAPDHPHHHSVGWVGNVGDGITAGRDIDSALDCDVVSPGLWQPSSLYRHRDGSEETILYGYLDRGRPGVIAVDDRGRRFVNESDSYHDVVTAMFRKGAAEGRRFYFICDRRFVWKRGLGLIRPYTPWLGGFARRGYITLGESPEHLARQLGINPEELAATIARHNGFAASGVDRDFGRGETAFNRTFGDPTVKPNPNLAPIGPGTLVALEILPSTLGTSVGLKIDAHARVLDSADRPIGGLYASGQDASPVMRGHYPGGGINIGPALTFSYLAIQDMAGQGRA